jgi:uncharacterized protein
MAAPRSPILKVTPPTVASYKHTLLVLVAILAVSGYELWFAHTGASLRQPGSERDIISDVYVPAIVYEWALLVLVWFGVRRSTGLRSLIGGKWGTARQAVTDFCLGFAFWGAWYVVERFVQYFLGPTTLNVNIDCFFPKDGWEITVWVFSAVTSGFCEEIIFRGYLLKQFSAWTGSLPIGLVLQAVLFGAAHPLLGVKQMVVITVSGLLFGLLALWRNNLRPGMVAHAWADIFGGIIFKGLPYK